MILSGPKSTLEQFQQGAARGIEAFRLGRLAEASEDYTSHYDEAEAAVEELLELTVDLTTLRPQGATALARFYEATRYLTAPPTSHDDLQTLSGVPGKFQDTVDGWPPTIETVMALLDTRRFPWLAEGRVPTEAERRAAVVATAAQIASRRVLTARANEAKTAQELLVRQTLEGAGFQQVEPRVINTFRTAPRPGQFCGESMLGSRKADVIAGLWDERLLAIECKVSNSAVNSVKRVKNDAGSKATKWLAEFGTQFLVPAAVIAGVYHPPNLLSAQADGLTIWWSHDLDQMVDWINRTRTR